MHGYLGLVQSSIHEFCDGLGYTPDRIGRVLLTGGTSLIPSIKRRMETLFRGKIVEVDPFLSIVKGFALGAWLSSQNRITSSAEHVQIDIA